MVGYMGYTYILKCNDNSYYVGATTDTLRRLFEHKNGKVKQTKSRLPIVLVFVKEFCSYGEARSFENKIKSWKKRESIEKTLNKPDNVVSRYN